MFVEVSVGVKVCVTVEVCVTVGVAVMMGVKVNVDVFVSVVVLVIVGVGVRKNPPAVEAIARKARSPSARMARKMTKTVFVFM